MTASAHPIGDRHDVEPHRRAKPLPPAVRPKIYKRIVPCLALVVALWWAQVVIIPLVLSVLISYGLEPIVAWLERRVVRRAVAVPLLLLTLLALGAAGAYRLRGEAVDFVDRLPVIAHTLAEAIQGASSGKAGPVSKVQQAASEIESAARNAGAREGRNAVTKVRIDEPAFRWTDWVWRGSHGLIEFSGQMIAVACLVYCLLAAGDLYKRKLVHLVPTLSEKKVTVEILAEIDRQIERYIAARIAISAIVGLVVWIAFDLMGVAAAGVWGVLSAVLFAVPIVGPAVVVAAAAVAAFVQFGSISRAAGVGAACIAIGALEGNVLTPFLLSKVGEMNAVAVFVSLLFWGWLWGLWGLLVAVPITAAAKAVSERIPDFAGFAELLKQ